MRPEEGESSPEYEESFISLTAPVKNRLRRERTAQRPVTCLHQVTLLRVGHRFHGYHAHSTYWTSTELLNLRHSLHQKQVKI